MTIALAIIFLAVLMIYCGLKDKSLRHALVGQSVAGNSKGLL